ncbi:MAG: TolC family outer membrane protein [Burkholderiales bacterium]|nr:TolC family outer membrane protein [Burkholderiales bacterium]PZN06250.1 MAG: channel protein TolC [Pseudomonadota bacterium]
MKRMSTWISNALRRGAVIGLLVAALPAQAIDLLEAYRLALQNDPEFAAARAQLEAGREALAQGRALLLPIITGSANTNINDVDNRTQGFDRRYNSHGWSITLTQPLFRWQNIMQYRQAEYQVQQAEARFGQAAQDLIVRVAEAYFNALAAQDNLEFVRANKAAIAEQLAQAKRNFEVGTATITDTNEAQARYDLATAQELAAVNEVEVTRRNLERIIGVVPDRLAPLRPDLQLAPPEPADMNAWVEAALAGNFGVLANQAAYEIAARQVEVQRAGHYPTLDAVASYQDSTSLGGGLASPTAQRQNTNAAVIGLQLNVPLFEGGSVSSRTREAVALREAARNNLEAARRAAEFSARQAFLNVTNGRAQVQALEQALVSSETALESNRVGYEVGVRINIDVLNAQQQVFQTKRDLARARYDTILNGLRLGAAAGALSEEQVRAVNQLLLTARPEAPAPQPGPVRLPDAAPQR